MDKLVVLARGLGTRMRRSDSAAALDGRQAAVADSGIKAMIPIGSAGKGVGSNLCEAPGTDRRLVEPFRQIGPDPFSCPIGRPFLDYVLSAAAEAGFRRACLVIGPEQEAIRRYYEGEAAAQRLAFDFAIQPEPKGTADAVAAAESFADGDPFAVINSDNYYPVEALRALREQSGCAAALFEREAMLAGGNIPAERIKRFAVAVIDGRGCLQRILEKPDDAALAALPKPLWLSMNCWRFGPSIFRACRAIEPSPRGEFEIPDAVQYAINSLGETFHAVLVRAPILDLTSRSDIASVAAMLKDVEVRL